MEEKEEIWIDIENYEGYYQVSNLGNVKSLSRKYCRKEKILKPFISGKYYKVNLRKNNKDYYVFVHHLIVNAFKIGKRDGMKQVVDHINNNKLDNRPENLQVISNRLNTSKNKKGKYSEYTGVQPTKNKKKWRSFIRINNKYTYLGVFDTETEAYNKYQEVLSQIEN